MYIKLFSKGYILTLVITILIFAGITVILSGCDQHTVGGNKVITDVTVKKYYTEGSKSKTYWIVFDKNGKSKDYKVQPSEYDDVTKYIEIDTKMKFDIAVTDDNHADVISLSKNRE